MQAGLQIFAWAESQIETRKQQRERYSGGSKSLSPEPMFCFERALKLLYFSALAYDIEEVSHGLSFPVNIPSSHCRLPSNVMYISCQAWEQHMDGGSDV